MVIQRGKDVSESEVFGTEESLAKISLELLDPKDDKLMSVTDVVPTECFAIPSMIALGKIFNSTLSDKWIRNFMLLRISRLRSGRTEFVIILSGMREYADLKKKGKISDLYSGL
jgi:hypothetical protein